jgi:hypothetical protein
MIERSNKGSGLCVDWIAIHVGRIQIASRKSVGQQQETNKVNVEKRDDCFSSLLARKKACKRAKRTGRQHNASSTQRRRKR